MKEANSRVKKKVRYFHAISIKKQLKSLPARFEDWRQKDGYPFSEPILYLPTYFLYLEELPYGMTADVWGFLSIEYSACSGYCVYESQASNALMEQLEQHSRELLFCSFSRQKVLRHCQKLYKNKRSTLPADYKADYMQ